MQVDQAFSLEKNCRDLTIHTCSWVHNTSDAELWGFGLSIFPLLSHMQIKSAGDRTSPCSLSFRALPSFVFKVSHFHPNLQHASLCPALTEPGWACGEKVCV